MTASTATAPREGQGQRYTVFALAVHGARVECFVSDTAIERWCADLCCDRANERRLSRIAREIVAAAMPAAGVTPGERWIARVGVGCVALTIDE